MNPPQVPNQVAIVLVSAWVLFWKGIGMWRAAKLEQKYWFMAFLLLFQYTLGILEIIYLFRFAKQRLTVEEMRSWLAKTNLRAKKT